MKSILTFGRGRMDRTAFLLGHLIGLVGGFCFVFIVDIIWGDWWVLFFIGGLLCFFGYSVTAMTWRFLDIGWNSKWVYCVFFPTLGQLLWFVLFFVCILTPSAEN